MPPEVFRTSARLTPRVLEATAAFGLRVDHAPNAHPKPNQHAVDAIRRLPPGHIALLVGPSGCGKSTTLRAAADIHPPARASHADRAIVDRLRMPLDRAIGLLSSVGLGEARLLALPEAALSDGQRFRFRLALWIARWTPGKDIFFGIDEFGFGLDDCSIIGIARTMRRAVLAHVKNGSGPRLILASARDDIDRLVHADAVIDLHESTDAVRRSRPPFEEPELILRPGTMADYAALERFHYLGGPPAVPSRVLAAERNGEPVGVLVTARPTPDARWRDLAWPGRYRTDDKRADLRRLNDEVRCIARVIIEPRHRGRGIARRLVSRALQDAETMHTEAIAQMGRYCPFFERAGMTAYPMPASTADARLLDALHTAELSMIDLADGARLPAWIETELRRWARHHKDTRQIADIAELRAQARMRLLRAPVAYAFARTG